VGCSTKQLTNSAGRRPLCEVLSLPLHRKNRQEKINKIESATRPVQRKDVGAEPGISQEDEEPTLSNRTDEREKVRIETIHVREHEAVGRSFI
jgi:hypothetical protein